MFVRGGGISLKDMLCIFTAASKKINKTPSRITYITMLQTTIFNGRQKMF